MNNYHYVLAPDGRTPIEAQPIEWAIWFETADRYVAKDTVDGNVQISTVFLGLDHSFGGPERLLWETMIFGGPHDGWCDRFSTYEAALQGHQHAVRVARAEAEKA